MVWSFFTTGAAGRGLWSLWWGSRECCEANMCPYSSWDVRTIVGETWDNPLCGWTLESLSTNTLRHVSSLLGNRWNLWLCLLSLAK